MTGDKIAAEPKPFMVLLFFSFFLRTIGLRISPYQTFAELRQEFVATVIFTTKRFVRAQSCG